MEINRNNIFEIIEKTNIKPDKDYGQNFLVEPEISNKICDCLKIEDKEKILEVGPGLGSLTHYLSQHNNQIDVVDIDERMTYFLKIVYENSSINIINSDIRKIDVSKYDKVISNLPYNITTELIQYFLINAISAKKFVFMIQSETFAHFSDISGKEYGPTSVLIHLLGNIEKVMTVKAGSFIPSPKCNSVVFVININNKIDRDEAIKTFKLAKQLFSNRRKTILNNLTNVLKNKDKAIKACNELNIDANLRPEQITPEKYLAISKYLA